MSTSLPGVATSRWQPLSRSLICWPMSAPPYTTQGRTLERYENCNAKSLSSFSTSCLAVICEHNVYVPSWLRRRSAAPVLWLGPVPGQWGTAYAGHTSHFPKTIITEWERHIGLKYVLHNVFCYLFFYLFSFCKYDLISKRQKYIPRSNFGG